VTTTWPTVVLETLFEVKSSKRVTKSEWKSKGVPFYRGREITELSKKGRVDNDIFISEEHFCDLEVRHGIPEVNDILITAIGTIGNSYVVKEADRFYFKDASVLWLKKKSDVDSQFINYWISSDSFKKQLDRGNGATVDTMTISGLSAMTLPLPPLDEQKRIVAKLDEAMGFIEKIKIRQATRVNETQRFAKNILTGLIPPTKDSISIMDICDFKGGAQPPKSTFVNNPQSGYVRFIQIRDFESDAHIVFIPESTKNRTCLESDVLVGRYGASVGRVCRGLAGAYNVALMKVVPDMEKVTTDFLEIFLKSDFFQKSLLELSIRSAQSGFNKEDLATIQFPKVSLDEQAILVEKYRAINALVSDLMRLSGQKSASITDFRSSMLSAAFAGAL
jgi:type I restriction enzyme S subunit